MFHPAEMSAQSLLHSVFSCSSSASGSTASTKGFSKRKLRQTRSLDPALIGGGGSDAGTEGGSRGSLSGRLYAPVPAPEGPGSRSTLCPRSLHPRATRLPPPRPLCASFSTPSTPQEKSPSGTFYFDYEVPLGRGVPKRSMAWEGGGGSNGIFASPRRWLQQRKILTPPGHRSSSSVVWKSQVGTARLCASV